MPAKSVAQLKFMQYVAHSPVAQKRTGLSKEKAQEFVTATKNKRGLPKRKKKEDK